MDVTWPDQCIVFDLPSGAAGMAAGMYKSWVIKQVSAFTNTNSINFRTHTQQYKLKIWFPDDKYYILFFLWFDPGDRPWRKPYLAHESLDEKNT